MNRRDFLTLAIAGLLPTAQGQSQAAGIYVRQNIYCLNRTSAVVQSYKQAVQVMRARSLANAHDPTGWVAQANIHGTFTSSPGMIESACQHGNLFFLSWHRMYLYFFERIARKASGDPSFALPYWGYSPSAPGRQVLPDAFRTPADSTNALYLSERNPLVNGGDNITASLLSADAALALVPFGSFSSSLEGTPHGVVHTAVGGSGFMSAFETAALDPIFWLHHANIDYLWEQWLNSAGGRANPTADTMWMNTTFDFYDENANRVTMKGAEIVSVSSQLNYTYASPTCPGSLPPPTNLRILRLSAGPTQGGPMTSNQTLLVQSARDVDLGSSSLEVKLVVSEEGKKLFAKYAADPTRNLLKLLLDNIRMVAPPRVVYEIYLNLPAGTREATFNSPHYVGNLDFFGLSPKGGHEHTAHRSFDLMTVYNRLRDQALWGNDTIKVTFVPRGFTEGDTPAKALSGKSQAMIGEISVRLESLEPRHLTMR